MKKRTFIITLAAIIVAAFVLFTFTVARADGFKRDPKADEINRQRKLEAAKRQGLVDSNANGKPSSKSSSKSGSKSSGKSKYFCDDSAGDKAKVAKPILAPETDGEWFEAWTVDEEGRAIYEVWKDVNHVGGSGKWERIYWHYIDEE